MHSPYNRGMTHDPSSAHIGTKVVHTGQRPDPSTGAVMPPISLATTYEQESPGVHKGLEYTRTHNPTRFALERMVAGLENSPLTEDDDLTGGGFAFASGLAAMATCLELMDAGSRIVAMDDIYGGSNRMLRRVRQRTQGLDVEFCDLSSLDRFAQAMTPVTKMVWVETPTNPTLKVADLSGISAIARKANPEAILVCDNTFATPINQTPLDHGFDIVLHSTTKYMGGHSDSLGGVLIASKPEHAETLRFLQNSLGAVMSPFEAYMTLRGIKTLDVRMARHNASAVEIARFLASHSQVERVVFPGLESHPHHEVVQKQMRGPGGMITFYLAGGLEESRRFLESLEIFALAESLGGVESLVEHPAIMTHASVPPEMRRELGISDNMIRLSVGVEDVRDLLADIEKGMAAAKGARAAAAASA